jgi:hypothetical protein
MAEMEVRLKSVLSDRLLLSTPDAMTTFNPILTSSSAVLKDILGDGKEFAASELWKWRPVCVMASSRHLEAETGTAF